MEAWSMEVKERNSEVEISSWTKSWGLKSCELGLGRTEYAGLVDRCRVSAELRVYEVVLAMALTAVSAGTIYTAGYPYAGFQGAYPYASFQGAYPYAGAAFQNAFPYAAAAPVPYAAAYPAPITYAAAPAAPLVAPAPYRVQTGVRTEVAVEPVEQHGYVIKY